MFLVTQFSFLTVYCNRKRPNILTQLADCGFIDENLIQLSDTSFTKIIN
jgi:hypothetical protein